MPSVSPNTATPDSDLPGPAAAGRWLSQGIAQLDSNGRVVSLNEALATWFELPASTIVGRSLWDLLAESFPAASDALPGFSQGTDVFARMKLVRPATSRESSEWLELHLARHPGGAVAILQSELPPLTELQEGGWDEHLKSDSARRELFVRLLQAEAQVDNLMHRWPGVIFNQSADLTIRFASSKIEELTGIPLSEWQSDPQIFWKLVHEADAEELRQRITLALKSPEGITSNYRIRNARTGRIIHILEQRRASMSKSGLLLSFEGVWLDVTRQIIAEKSLTAASWKDTLAIVTMGLSHDFSNVLAGIHSLSESYLAQIDDSHPFKDGLALIKKSSLQASQLVRRILDLHQNKRGDRSYHDLNELLTDLAELIRKIVLRRIEFNTELEPASTPLYIDAVEFREVIINLVLNAADAMPQTGRLVLRTSIHHTLPALVNGRGAMPRPPAVCLTVQDSGIGIKSRHLPNVFDPFFTTKPLNRGSGLGLYNARLFAEKHHGAISVESTERIGTSFHLWLPQADFTEMDRVDTPHDYQRVRRSIVLIGQLGDTLNGTAEFLRVAGYHVVTASGEDSIAGLLQNSDYSFSAMMLLAEPGDAGVLARLEEARRTHPTLKIILKLLGGDPDDVEKRVLGQSDLIISRDTSQSSVVEKLHDLFSTEN